MEKLSSSEDENVFLKCSHQVLPKKKIFNDMMEFDDDFVLDKDALDALFEGNNLN